MNILLKLVMIKISLGPFSLSTPLRYFGRSTTVSTVSRGLKIPSTAGWAWGMGLTGAEIMISLTFATLMPYRFPPMVNSMISISLVPDSNRIFSLCISAMINTPIYNKISLFAARSEQDVLPAVGPDAALAADHVK